MVQSSPVFTILFDDDGQSVDGHEMIVIVRGRSGLDRQLCNKYPIEASRMELNAKRTNWANRSPVHFSMSESGVIETA